MVELASIEGISKYVYSMVPVKPLSAKFFLSKKYKLVNTATMY
jgi:hypothetical protein